MADGSKINRIELPKLLNSAYRQGFARLEIPLAAPIKMLRLESELFELGNVGQDLEGLGCHFGPRTVAGNYRDFEWICHRGILCARESKCVGTLSLSVAENYHKDERRADHVQCRSLV